MLARARAWLASWPPRRPYVYVALAPSPDYRYSHSMILCTMIVAMTLLARFAPPLPLTPSEHSPKANASRGAVDSAHELP